MADPLIDYLKIGFPKESLSGKSYRISLEYVGDYTTLRAGLPAIGTTSDVYSGRVVASDVIPIPGSTYGDASVDYEYEFESEESGTKSGEENGVTTEVEWAKIDRDLIEHKEFRPGENGTYQLTTADKAAIDKWMEEEDATKKAIYQYKPSRSSAYTTLSANATKFARGIVLGITTWEDFAPIIRITTSLVNGGSSTSEAGNKDDPPSFEGKPEGYEWRKSADRSVKSGKQNEWERVEEWMGAEKVLVDKNEIYYE